MSALNDPIVLGVIAAGPAAAVGYLGYRRSKRADAVTEQLGIQSGSAQSIAQAFDGLNKVIAGLNTYIAILQADHAVDAEDIRRLTEQRDALQIELNRMYRKYGNGLK